MFYDWFHHESAYRYDELLREADKERLLAQLDVPAARTSGIWAAAMLRLGSALINLGEKLRMPYTPDCADSVPAAVK